MPAGRPTDYDETVIPTTEEYIKACFDQEDEFHATRGSKSDGYQRLVRVRLPTIEGLAVVLDVNKTTLYEWESKHEEFSNVLSKLRDIQANRLINEGLSGDYNPVIAKLLLMKHGYVEKTATDLTSKGDKIATASGGEDIALIAQKVGEELKKKKEEANAKE